MNTGVVSGATDGVDSTLRFLWNSHNISLAHQEAFTQAGCHSMAIFKGMASSEEDMRSCLAQELGLVANSMANRVALANVLAVWSAAWERTDAETKAKAESRASGAVQVATTLEMSSLANAYKLTVMKGERLEPKEKPSRSYLGRKLQEIEEGELDTEPVMDVTRKGDGEEPDSMLEILDSS